MEHERRNVELVQGELSDPASVPAAHGRRFDKICSCSRSATPATRFGVEHIRLAHPLQRDGLDHAQRLAAAGLTIDAAIEPELSAKARERYPHKQDWLNQHLGVILFVLNTR